MSVVKSKRSQSSIEFEALYFLIADGVDNLVGHKFYATKEMIDLNEVFLEMRSTTLEKLTDDLLYYIKIANSIYPICITEWEERRLSIGKAIGTCYAILTNYLRIMTRLRIADNKYTLDIQNVARMINSLKAWRKSDNRLRNSLELKQVITRFGSEGVSASNAANVNNNGNANNNTANNGNYVAGINPDVPTYKCQSTFRG